MGNIVSYGLLATMIGRKYNIKIQSKGRSAYTRYDKEEGFIINLPEMTREEDFPVMLGYAWHEIAHIRFTEFDLLRGYNRFTKALINIFEDIRVERRIVQDYPGMYQDFCKLCDVVYKDAIVDSLINYVLAYVRKLPLSFDLIPKDLQAMLSPLLDRAKLTQSTQDCIDLAKEVYDLLKDNIPEEQEGEEGEGEGGEGEGGEGQQSKRPSFSTELKDPKYNDLAAAIARDYESCGDIATRAGRLDFTYHAENKLLEMPEELAEEAMQISSAMVNTFLNFVQAYNLGYVGSQIRGKVNTHNLYRLSLNDNRVFSRKLVQHANNTRISIILDGSSSMFGTKIQNACMAGYALIKALRQIRGVAISEWIFFNKTVLPLCTFEQNIDNCKPYVHFPEGGTPMGYAYSKMLSSVYIDDPLCKQVGICITDGFFDDEEVFTSTVALAKQLGIQTYGIGIGTNGIAKVLPENSCVIAHVRDLPKTMLTLLEKVICSDA